MQVFRGMDALTIYYDSAETKMLHHIRTLPGITIDYVSAGNGPGTGYLRYRNGYLNWKAPGSSEYGTQELAIDGKQVLLQDGQKYVRVTIDTDYVLEGSESAVYIEDVYENAVSHDDVTAGEATAGDITDYNCTMHNNSGNVISKLKVWLKADNVEISNDDATYVSPTVEGSALEFDDIPGGGDATLYFRRTIAAGAEYDADVLTQIYFSFETV